MPRRIGARPVTVPKTDAPVAEAVKPKRVPRARRPAAPPKLDGGAAKPGAPVQRNVYEVKERKPETVDAALEKLDQLAGVEVQPLGDIDGHAISVVRLNGAPPPPGVEPRRVLLSGGVHGSEPAGAIAAVELIELIANHPELFPGYEFTVVPLVNPEGFRDGTRANENDGKDLNREAEHDHDVPMEMQLVLPVLDEGPWALALDLHASGSTTAAGKNGFFAIRTGGHGDLLHEVMSEFAKEHPVLDETTQKYTMVEARVMQSQNEGTVKGYLYKTGTTAAFTLEAPARLDMRTQVDGLIDLVQGFLSKL